MNIRGRSSILTIVFAGLILLFHEPFIDVALPESSEFRVPPYIQNPAPDAMTIVWFSEKDLQGRLSYGNVSNPAATITTKPVRSDALAYPEWEVTNFFSGKAPLPPFRHTIRLTGLTPDTAYTYTVEQGISRFTSSFRTAPALERAVRFIVYSDSETEPESTGQCADWSDPTGVMPKRTYLIDQTLGYANNLKVINSRNPDFVIVAGDLVQHGGEQRDWDEFWRHITDTDGSKSIAAHIPFLASLGNHEYYEGPSLGQYNQSGSECAVGRYLIYFEYPSNGADNSAQRNRYYRIDYGPITLIALDVANGSPHQTDHDTNFFLKGELDPDGGHAPDFNPGSNQYRWLERQLKEAQSKSRFTFVVFHHIPYSVGPHGWPAGEGEAHDTQSGRPARILDQLFMKYGVDAVLCGHDEMLERSEISGVEIVPDGSDCQHVVQYYDAGIGGDGLRGPEKGLVNPYQKFLVHTDAPEIWNNGVLIDGGKHYGHLEINVAGTANGQWSAVITPVYVFPLVTKDGTYIGYERRQYNDVMTLDGRDLTPTTVTLTSPNGYESWTAGTSHNIIWTSSNVTNAKLEYSTDNGVAWNLLADNIDATTHSYSWKVPETLSAKCLVRITDVANPSLGDISDAPFSILDYNANAGFVVDADLRTSGNQGAESINSIDGGKLIGFAFYAKDWENVRGFTVSFSWDLVKAEYRSSLSSPNISNDKITLNNATFTPVIEQNILTGSLLSAGEENRPGYYINSFAMAGSSPVGAPDGLIYHAIFRTAATFAVGDTLSIRATVKIADEYSVVKELGAKFFTVQKGLLPPSNLTVLDVPNDNGHRLRLAWTASASEKEGLVSGYRIYRSRTNIFTDPLPLSRFSVLDSLLFYEQRYTILIDSVTVGKTEYIDPFVPLNKAPYYYWAQAFGKTGASKPVISSTATAVEELAQTPQEFKLGDVYPNPFNPSTTIEYSLSREVQIILEIYNISGQKVATVDSGRKSAGKHTVLWDAHSLPSGVYFYTFQAEGYVKTGKALLMK